MANSSVNLSRFLAWLRRVGHWTFAPKPVQAGIVVAAAVIVVLFNPSEPVVRITGLMLQILGISTVIASIEQTRRLFGHPTMLQSFAGWLKRFPRYKHHLTAVALEGVGAIISGGKLRTKTWSRAPANATLDQRAASVEANVAQLDKRIDQTHQELDGLENKQTAALDQERRERAAEDSKINEKVEAGHTGGLHISAIGALWLFFGIIMSTAAPEIAQWIR